MAEAVPEEPQESLYCPKELLDFRNFLWLAWQHLGHPQPTKLQYDIAQFLQHGPRRLVVEAFRGLGKTTICSAFVCWTLLRNPESKILVLSASKPHADNFSTFVKRLIREMPVLQPLLPREGQRDSNVSFDVGPATAAQAPSVRSIGITGQVAGSRADLLVADDVETLNNSLTPIQRERLRYAIKEVDAILKPGGRVCFLGTPQTEESIYQDLPNEGYTLRVWPSRYPKDAGVYAGALAPIIVDALSEDPELSDSEFCSIAGKPTDERYGEEDLVERELRGRSWYSLQFQLDTRLSDLDRYPLKVRELSVLDLDADAAPEKVIWGSMDDLKTDLPCTGFTADRFFRPKALQGDWVPYTGSVMFVDPSGRGKDETAVAVVKTLNSQLFVPCVRGFGPGKGFEPEVLQEIADLAKAHKVNLIQVEANMGDGMFVSLLQPYLRSTYPVTVEEVKATVQKERRICDVLEPILNQHRLIIDPQVIKDDYQSIKRMTMEAAATYSLIYQLARITRDRGCLVHDDRLDALAGACAYWASAMAQSQDDQMSARREAAIQAELEKFMKDARAFYGHEKVGTWGGI